MNKTCSAPHGLEQIKLALNDTVTVEGEIKPSELKVERLTRAGKTIHIEHKKSIITIIITTRTPIL